MLQKDYSASRIRGLEDTMGMFTLYLVFKKNTVPYTNHNFYHFNQDNVWIASDYDHDKMAQNYLFMHTATSGARGICRKRFGYYLYGLSAR